MSLSDRTLSTGYSATINGVQTVEVRPQVSGMIVDILIEEGESVSRVELDKKQIVTLQATVWNTQQLMRYGNANYLEVLTAQKNLLSAELAEVSDRFEEIRSVITLYHALGGGWGE